MRPWDLTYSKNFVENNTIAPAEINIKKTCNRLIKHRYNCGSDGDFKRGSSYLGEGEDLC